MLLRLAFNRLSALWITLILGPFALAEEENPLRELESELRPTVFVEAALSVDTRTAIEKAHAPVLRRENEIVDVRAEAEPLPVDGVAAQGDAISLAELKENLSQAQRAEGLDEEEQKKIVQLIEQSIEWLKIASENEKKSHRAFTEASGIPKLVAKLRSQLESTPPAPELPSLQSAAVALVEKGTQKIADSLVEAREAFAKHQARSEGLQTTRKQAVEKLKAIAEQLEKLDEEISADPPQDATPLYVTAQANELKARRKMVQSRHELLKAESKLATSMKEVGPLQHDLDQRTISQLEAEHKYWQGVLSAKQQAEAERRVAEATRKAQAADPALQELANDNAKLAETLSKYNQRRRRVITEKESITEQFNTQEREFESLKYRVAQAGMNEAIGVLLKGQFHKLIDSETFRSRAAEIEKELPRVALELLEYRERHLAMWDLASDTEQRVALLTSRLSEDEARKMVADLLQTQRDYLAKLISVMEPYEQALADLHSTLLNTADVTLQHREFINEHVLWTRSAAPVSAGDVKAARLGIAELFQWEKWLAVVRDTANAMQRQISLSLGAFLGLLVCLVLCDRMKDRITTLGQSKAVTTTFRFWPTAEVAMYTVVLACFLPAICYFISWCVLRSSNSSDLTQPIGVGLQWASIMWFALSLLQQVTRQGGLAECHFGWHQGNLAVVRQNLRLLTTFGLPAVFIVMVIETYEDGKWIPSLGRLSFIAGMLVMALFMHRLLNPYRSGGGIWAKRDVWLFRLRHLLHAGGAIVPVAFAILSAVGYVYSAHQLAYRAQLSLWIVLVIVLSHAMLSRYLTIARRHAAVRHTQRRRAESEEGDQHVAPADDLDFQAIGTQLQRLLRGYVAVAFVLGATFVWADMVPALRKLDRIHVSSTTQTVVEQVPIEDGIKTVEQERTVPISVADCLLGLLTVIATIVAARNVPGLLNVTVLEKLPIDYGTRYALTAVTRYALSLVGIVTAFHLVGITWSSVQWLVAAMTVGLGFGLQEIFANFVSGLIILTERPVRVGDMVTVGGLTGKVTRVQIRATTVTDFDRRELVIPNKRFITENVINWTLSDPITRVVLRVGIAYRCDPKLACEKLLSVADEHPLVLKEPEATAVFVGFGDSTLDLELRVFIVGRDNLYQVRDELNVAINSTFKAADLEIAFPQRDLNIRSVDGVAMKNLLESDPRKAA